jgi:hypothetical protein
MCIITLLSFWWNVGNFGVPVFELWIFIHNCQNFCTTWHVTLLLRSNMQYILYRWLPPLFSRLALTVRSVPTGYTRRAFHALRGRHLAPQATPLRLSTRRSSLSTWACPATGWPSPCPLTGPPQLVWPELHVLVPSWAGDRRVGCPMGADGLLWPQPGWGGPIPIWVVPGSGPTWTSMVGPCGPLTGATSARGSARRHADIDTLLGRLVHLFRHCATPLSWCWASIWSLLG